MPTFEKIKEELAAKTEEREGVFFYLPKMTEFQKREIWFHDDMHQAEEEVHQLNALRNVFYHGYFKKFLFGLPQDSIILEIGSGSGYDLWPVLDKGYQVIASDISPASVKAIKEKVEVKSPSSANRIICLVADGQNLPFPDNSVDAAFMAACLHHFENQNKALNEISRVVKPGGLIICAMEPSRFMMKFTKIFAHAKSLRIHEGHSEADETHPGYSRADLDRLASSKLSIAKLKRVWLLQGFVHYGLEALFRIFKLKKRIVLPRWPEWLILVLDEILLKIPLINQLNWHWIVIFHT